MQTLAVPVAQHQEHKESKKKETGSSEDRELGRRWEKGREERVIDSCQLCYNIPVGAAALALLLTLVLLSSSL